MPNRDGQAMSRSNVAQRLSLAVTMAYPLVRSFNGPLTDVALALQHPARVLAPVALAPELAHDARVHHRLPPTFLSQRMRLDRLDADAEFPGLLQDPGDLLGAPTLSEQPATRAMCSALKRAPLRHRRRLAVA